MKKLEIIIESVELSKVIKAIEKVGVRGYSLIKDISGMGKHGKSVSTSLVDVNEYNMLVIVDDEVKINQVIEKVKPIIKIYSGIMFLSDAEIISC